MDYKDNIYMLPEHMRGAMLRWIENGINPGSFLTAVLENNLLEAYGRADYINQQRMKDYMQYLYNYAPSGCWGSPEKVAKWKGLETCSS
jgi:hypothetical protein